MEQPWFGNGIDARTGRHLVHESLDVMVKIALGEDVSALDDPALKARRAAAEETFSAKLPAEELAETGWAVVFPALETDDQEGRAEQAAIREALSPLLELRRAQAGPLYRELTDADGFWPRDTCASFLRRQRVSAGRFRADRVPYYLLLIGSPAQIPFREQSMLSVQYAVGRLNFSKVEDYATYAQNVVRAESQTHQGPRRAAFFAPSIAGDPSTQLSARYLAEPLANALTHQPEADWTVETAIGDQAVRQRLDSWQNGGQAPSLLFAASHGLGFDRSDARQRHEQGALLCQDWQGGPVDTDAHAFAGDHLASNADLNGQIAFFFACYGLGTPRRDEYAHRRYADDRRMIADVPFVAHLPQRMLSRPNGALAVIGHVERAWGSSFIGEGHTEANPNPQINVFEHTMESLTSGRSVGASLDDIGLWFAELATRVTSIIEDIRWDAVGLEQALVEAWTAHNDARGYALLGDPAVRLPVEEEQPQSAASPT